MASLQQRFNENVDLRLVLLPGTYLSQNTPARFEETAFLGQRNTLVLAQTSNNAAAAAASQAKRDGFCVPQLNSNKNSVSCERRVLIFQAHKSPRSFKSSKAAVRVKVQIEM